MRLHLRRAGEDCAGEGSGGQAGTKADEGVDTGMVRRVRPALNGDLRCRCAKKKPAPNPNTPPPPANPNTPNNPNTPVIG